MLYLLNSLITIFNVILFVTLMAISIENYFTFVVVISLVGSLLMMFDDYTMFMFVILVLLVRDLLLDLQMFDDMYDHVYVY